MSVEMTIVCDKCSAIISAGQTLDAARADAKHAGATRVTGFDYCRSCAALGDVYRTA